MKWLTNRLAAFSTGAASFHVARYGVAAAVVAAACIGGGRAEAQSSSAAKAFSPDRVMQGRLIAAAVQAGVPRAAAENTFVMHTATAGAPTLVSGSILNTSINLTSPPAAPILKLTFSSAPTTFGYWFQSPLSSKISAFTYEYPVAAQTAFQVQDVNVYFGGGYPYDGGAFNAYTESGSWTLAYLYVCNASGCTDYSGSLLTAIFGNTAVQVTNPRKPDITPPAMISGSIKTPSVSLGSSPVLDVAINASDDNSGAYQVALTLKPPSGGDFNIFGTAFQPRTSGAFQAEYSFQNTGMQIGAYTIVAATLYDVAGNSSYYAGSQLSALFPQGTSFMVTN